MSDKSKIRVGITQGDINGIGYEIIFRTFEDPEMFEICTPVIYGSPKLAAYHRKALDIEINYNAIEDAAAMEDGKLNIINCNADDVHIELGVATKESGQAAYEALEQAVKDYKEGKIDVLVTAPINKNSIQNDEFQFPGHTEYLQERVGDGEKSLMILCSGNLRFAVATSHLPLSEVAAAITPELLEEKLKAFDKSLKEDFDIDAPRIAVLSLNPHAGDNGLLGKEEIETIKPCIEKMSREGICCYGPFGSDGFMGSGKYTHFDGILAMYHDQGLTPMKLLAMDDGVNFTAGLQLVRTSPDHGVAYDIAGKGCAGENSFRQAIYAAIDIYRNRKFYNDARRHPLRKLYHEKHDDSNRLNLQQEEKE